MKKSNPAQTVLTISMGFLVLFLIYGWYWVLMISLGVGIAGVFSPWLSKKIDFIWMKLAWILSLVIPPVILTIIFYLVLFPLAVLSRLLGNPDPLNLKDRTDSLFTSSGKTFEKRDFEKIW